MFNDKKIVLDLSRELHNEEHTIVMVTHDRQVAMCAERCISLEYGRISKIEEMR